MKKVLLFSAAMMSMSLAATAQEAVKTNLSTARSIMKEAKVAPVSAIACDTKYDAAATKANRRSIATGVSYGRPEGTYYVSGTSGSVKYQYLYIPAFVDVTYKNYAKDKANAKWYYGASTLYEWQGDENNNFTVNWPLIERGYINSAYVPTLAVGEETYKFGEELGLTQNCLINGDSILSVTQVNRAGGAYYGFTDGAVFGSADRTMTIDGKDVECKQGAIYEIFSKPTVPFCLNQIEFPVVSYNKSEMIPAGTTMYLYIVKMTEDGKLTNEVTEVLPFTKDDIEDFEILNGEVSIGFISLSKKTEDDFGTEIEEPIIIDYPFAIIIDGFAQKGVDFSLYMCNVMATERDYYEEEGGIEGTLCEYVRTDTGETLDGLYYCQTISKTGPNAAFARQYNALIYLTGMFDVVSLIPGCEQLIAPVEGGYVYAELEDGDYSLQYFTTCPRLSDWDGIEGEENYWFVGMPEWLTVKQYVDEYFAEDNVTIAVIEAEPLPAGVESRSAEIRLVSAKGADSGVITVTQGATTGISTVTTSGKTGSATSYNLSGQQVNDSFKGLMIKDGKKYITK